MLLEFDFDNIFLKEIYLFRNLFIKWELKIIFRGKLSILKEYNLVIK